MREIFTLRKKIISLATGIPTSSFYGGLPSNSYLRSRGFNVVELRTSTEALENLGPLSENIFVIEAQQEDGFNPQDQEDTRNKALRTVVERRGQAAFRKKLIKVFQARCAISGCECLPVLEAAHITPYLGAASNDVSNGLLLRADLHTLWDLALIAVHPENFTVWVSPSVTDAMYRSFDGSVLRMPPPKHIRPSAEALRAQWDLATFENPD